MKTQSLVGAIAITGICLLSVASYARIHGGHDISVSEAALRLPTAADTRHSLSTTPRHIEWIAAPLGAKRILGFIVSPERSDRAPVVIVTAHDQAASDWARAVADRVDSLL